MIDSVDESEADPLPETRKPPVMWDSANVEVALR